MFNHLKDMIWLACSMMLCIGAVVYTLDVAHSSSAAVEHLIPHVQIQERSISLNSTSPVSAAVLDRYSGLEILYSLPEFKQKGIALTVDGVSLPLTGDGMEELSRLGNTSVQSQMIDVHSLYEMRLSYDSGGRIAGVAFLRVK